MIQVGQPVPDIEVKAFHNGEEKSIRLADYKGQWVVMIFYPADFTFVCPTELEDAADKYEEFQKSGAEVMSVSTDTHFVHKAWHDSSPSIGKIKFPMLADPTGKLCREFGTYLEGDGLSLRGTFIIDPDGVLQAYEVNSNNIGRNAKETLRKLRAAKFVKENPGNVCPANWDEGSETLKPGLDLVGKI